MENGPMDTDERLEIVEYLLELDVVGRGGARSGVRFFDSLIDWPENLVCTEDPVWKDNTETLELRA